VSAAAAAVQVSLRALVERRTPLAALPPRAAVASGDAIVCITQKLNKEASLLSVRK
jgi:hypothetical protein